MAKMCIICGDPIYGRARKYCEKCKRNVHLSQMNDYYIAHTNRYQYGGLYYKNRNPNQCIGTSGLGERAIKDHDEELKKIEKEMINLGIRKPTK